MKIRVCLICIAVAGTWVGLLVARYFGAQIDTALISMLMGGSVVGLSYTLGKKVSAGSEMAWKFATIPFGFLAVYMALTVQWKIFAAAIALLALVSWFFFGQRGSKPTSVEARALEEKMKNCC